MSVKHAVLPASSARPRVGRRAMLVLGCAVLAMSTAACESTEQESAQLAKDATKHASTVKTLTLGASDRAVRVSGATLLQSSESAAVAVHLTSSHALAGLPIAITVKSAKGALLYTNETAGLEASLQHMALLPRGGGWWVDSQVLGVEGPGKVSVKVGSTGARTVAGAVPDLAASRVRVGELDGEHEISGVLANRSQIAQTKLPVYAVTLKGSTVTAAGSAIVQSLPAGASKVAFQIFLVGNPAGAKVQITVAPTAT